MRVLAVFGLAAAACSGDPAPGDSPDAAVDLTPAVAIPGARCAPAERAGLVEINADRRVFAYLLDRPDPQLGEPALSDSACAFHEYRLKAPCEPCDEGELCGLDSRCAAAPRRALDGRVMIRDGQQQQTFTADPEIGDLGGELTLSGSDFTVEVVGFGQTVTLEQATAIPEPLANLAASLSGTLDDPQAIDASWNPRAGGGQLFTHIPINHHAGGATFTECAVAASTGSLHVDQPMLEPLAVSTGLEFQSFEHVRFAAAETSRGCVEIRFSRRLDERPE